MLISTVTDAVSAEAAEWQSRPLEPLYPVVFFDAIRVKVRDEGVVRNKAVYLALGVTPDGRKEVLGLWIESTKGAKFWLRIVNELRNRGVIDILIAVVDGLKGFPEAINAAFPQTLVQTCIVHLIRTSLAYVSWQDRREAVAALKPVYVALLHGSTHRSQCLQRHLTLCDADGNRASQLQHTVQDVDRDGYLGDTMLVLATAHPIADHLLVTPDGVFDPAACVVAGNPAQ